MHLHQGLGKPVGRFPPQKQKHRRTKSAARRGRKRRRRAVQSQPCINLALARVYINDEESKLGTLTWQEGMGNIVAKKSHEKKRHWESAIRDKNFDGIPDLCGDVGVEHFRGKQFAMKDHPFAVSSKVQRDKLFKLGS